MDRTRDIFQIQIDYRENINEMVDGLDVYDENITRKYHLPQRTDVAKFECRLFSIADLLRKEILLKEAADRISREPVEPIIVEQPIVFWEPAGIEHVVHFGKTFPTNELGNLMIIGTGSIAEVYYREPDYMGETYFYMPMIIAGEDTPVLFNKTVSTIRGGSPKWRFLAVNPLK